MVFLTLEFFVSLQFSASTIIDVGVSRGTPWLYHSFPENNFILVDPIPGFDKFLVDPPKNYECVNLALGSSNGTVMLDLRGPRSSVHRWSKESNSVSEGLIEVDVDTLDALIERHVPSGLIGLKIDTEGHEVDVLRGLLEKSSRIEFIVCECSVRRRFDDDYRFSDLIAEAALKGFEFYNFISAQKARPVHYDVLFLRSDDRRFGLGCF
ncbi:FkbM family methyltransferase [Lamprobacter modestohalophilus]|uniref:FkbM family methyltransferase n=1 Tax=Lamprobacter modestohalophilus TaxID=1064514 RepID=UPI002ADEB75F|nr:FkbM family methyltransferase [Lamprobacter modestohalophilus]MEA1052140.1 FkbM family methyltransferase [Lamprobacter modestohalophilus]